MSSSGGVYLVKIDDFDFYVEYPTPDEKPFYPEEVLPIMFTIKSSINPFAAKHKTLVPTFEYQCVYCRKASYGSELGYQTLYSRQFGYHYRAYYCPRCECFIDIGIWNQL